VQIAQRADPCFEHEAKALRRDGGQVADLAIGMGGSAASALSDASVTAGRTRFMPASTSQRRAMA
jgi:hypothetical protein